MPDDIKQLMSRVFAVPVAQIPDDAAIGNPAVWDSLSHLELMLSLETELGWRLSTDDLLELTSLEAIRERLRSEPSLQPVP